MANVKLNATPLALSMIWSFSRLRKNTLMMEYNETFSRREKRMPRVQLIITLPGFQLRMSRLCLNFMNECIPTFSHLQFMNRIKQT